MPLFDDTDIRSAEVNAWFGVRTLLTQIPEMQELSESSEVELAASIVIGPVDDPLDKDTYSIDELTTEFSETIRNTPGATATPSTGRHRSPTTSSTFT